ncbi:MAG: hypothetical protein DHS20C21_17450 [Gemmatimonadota bacterium]|nr:MAG: hypothetical protein DHS20C21_17450 [Gemmatimonadota bacterium]
MKHRVVGCLAVLLVIAVPVVGHALERTRAPAVEREPDDRWALGCTATISYYNLCAGWIWSWSGWAPEEEIGVAFNTSFCTDVYAIDTSFHYAIEGAPAGYGYTGTLEVRYSSPLDCPQGSTIAAQPFLPASGWNTVFWGISPPWGAQAYSLVWRNADVLSSPVRWGTDGPASAACYPSGGRVRSARFGTPSAPLCPGDPFPGSGGAAELLWGITGPLAEWVNPVVAAPEGVARERWSRVKAMYR